MNIDDAIALYQSEGVEVVPNEDGSGFLLTFQGETSFATAEEMIQEMVENPPYFWPQGKQWPPMTVRIVKDEFGDETRESVFDWSTYQKVLQADITRPEPSYKGFPATPEGKVQAEAQAKAVGGKVVYDSATNTYRVDPTQTEGLGQPEFTTGPDGNQWVRTSPEGAWQPYNPPQRSFDEMWASMADPLFDAGDYNAVATLYDQRQAIESGRLDPLTLYNLVAPMAQNPQHFAELWNSFATEYDNWRQQGLGQGAQAGGFGVTAQGATGSDVFPGGANVYAPGDTEIDQGAEGIGPPFKASTQTAGQVVGETGVRWLARTGQKYPNGMTKENWDALGPEAQEIALAMEEAFTLTPEQLAAVKANREASQARTKTFAGTSQGAGFAVTGGLPVQGQPTKQTFASTTTPTTAQSPFAPTMKLPKGLPNFGGGTMAEGSGFAPVPKNPWAAAFVTDPKTGFNPGQQRKYMARSLQRVWK